MKKTGLYFLGSLTSLFLMSSCASIPKDAPDELKQANTEIERSKELGSDKYMPKTVMNAKKELDDSVKVFKDSTSSSDKAADVERSIKLATDAKNLARGANELTQKMQTWDDNIRDLEGNYSIIKLTTDVKELKATTAQLQKERDEALAQKPLMVKSPFAKVDSFRLDIPAVYFDTDSSVVSSAYAKSIGELSKTISPIDEFKVTIFGYADARGSKAYNEKLSTERAHNVALLLERNGIKADRIHVQGLGERYSSETEKSSGLQLERKVIITVTAAKPN